MKALRNLLIFLVILGIAGFFMPVNLRNGYFHYFYGRIVEQSSGNLGKAVASYKLATEAMPENPTFVRAYLRSLNDLGVSLNDPENARTHFMTALRFAEDWLKKHEFSNGKWQVLIEKARAEWGLDRKTSAKVSIDSAVKLMPTDYTALVYQGIIYRDISPNNRNDLAVALNIFEQALAVKRETNAYWAHFEMAKTYLLMKDEVSALNELNQALAQWPPRKMRQDIERLKNQIQSSGRSEK